MYYDFKFLIAHEMDEVHDIVEGPGRYLCVVLNDVLMYMISVYYLLVMYILMVFNMYAFVEYIRIVQCYSD